MMENVHWQFHAWRQGALPKDFLSNHCDSNVTSIELHFIMLGD